MVRVAAPHLVSARKPCALGSAAFCLFASEWWRREYEGGHWKWEPLLAAVGLEGIASQQLYLIVERGLCLWKRDLLKIAVGRAFLITLACEGGLPLRLVRRDGNRLRHYFQALLEEFRIHRRAGRDPEWLAERASHKLPRSLRQKVVFAISGQLIAQIWDLQAKVGNAEDPLLALDRADPGWRDRLPLKIEDATAEALLNNLMEEASRLAAAEPTRISVARFLKETLSGFELTAEVDLPGVTSAADLARLLEEHDEAELSSRLELYAVDEVEIPYLLAYASQRVRSGRPEYLLEKPGRAALTLNGATAAKSLRIVAAAGSKRTRARLLPQGEALSSVPWTFVSSSDMDSPRLCGQGAVRTRYPDAWVAAPDSFSPQPGEGSSCKLVGRLEDLGRSVYRVSGCVRFHDTEGMFCAVKTEQAAESSPEYKLVGELVQLRVQHAVYSSAPKLYCYETANSRPRLVPPGETQWRPAGRGSWQSGSPCGFGLIDLRHVVGGELRFRTKLGIVPPSLSVVSKYGGTYREGSVELSGLEGGKIGWLDIPGVVMELVSPGEPGDAEVVLRCVAVEEPPGDLVLVLTWDNGAALEVSTPFPAKGARFLVADRKSLPDGAVISFHRISGVRAVATSNRIRDRFVVTGKLMAEDVAASLNRVVGVWEPLPGESGIFRLDLSYLADQFAQLFSASGHLDAQVNLRIQDAIGPAQGDRRLDVRRFDVELHPNREDQSVRLVTHGAEAITRKDAGNFEVEARALWDPLREPVSLSLIAGDLGNASPRWTVNESLLEPGPWLIVGWEGSWCRFRPLLWTVGDISGNKLGHSNGAPTLGDAIRLSDPEERRRALDDSLQRLVTDPADPNWGLLAEYFTGFRGLPSASLDLFGRLADHPKAAAGLLIRADETQFDVVFERLEELPFSWHLVPVEAWVQSAASLAQHYRDQFRNLEGKIDALLRRVFGTFINRAPHRLEPLGLVIELLVGLDVIPGPVERPGLLGLARSPQGGQVLFQRLQAARQDLLRAQADTQWPHGHEVARWVSSNQEIARQFTGLWFAPPDGAGFRSDILQAPIVAALACVFNSPAGPSLACEIKRLRRFDERWFDTAYSVAMALAICQMLQA